VLRQSRERETSDSSLHTLFDAPAGVVSEQNIGTMSSLFKGIDLTGDAGADDINRISWQ